MVIQVLNQQTLGGSGNSSFSKLQDIAMENGPVDDLQMLYIYTYIHLMSFQSDVTGISQHFCKSRQRIEMVPGGCFI
jgi:hypothetical protein